MLTENLSFHLQAYCQMAYVFILFYFLYRKFVERELFKPDEIPERHNLSFFPTVNDIKNHIHEVQKSLGNGDMVFNSEIIPATV